MDQTMPQVMPYCRQQIAVCCSVLRTMLLRYSNANISAHYQQMSPPVNYAILLSELGTCA